MDKHVLPYRRGWPTLLPLPLDIDTDSADEIVPNAWAKAQLGTVKSILTAERIDGPMVQALFACRAPLGVHDRRIGYLTLLVVLDMVKDGDRVEMAIVRIRSAFCKVNMSDKATKSLPIESIDYRTWFRPTTYPIHHTEYEILGKWSPIQDGLSQVLDPKDWPFFELIHKGFEENIHLCPPNVCIDSPTMGDPK
ncbi:hypothetical protein K458DRAFT_394238 [Lentithecium fluviatile CBS 122367]|uniref:Uncharacterized protein n=1 Tax=Lentithecium fluviatile CBS 122367 TaxID=1168545 RepID=A0A6G1IMC0_9PLEO|nr:hypothetical protein K458DRAFT_394238 [Lentithecium fluviatile CBS 122367]